VRPPLDTSLPTVHFFATRLLSSCPHFPFFSSLEPSSPMRIAHVFPSIFSNFPLRSHRYVGHVVPERAGPAFPETFPSFSYVSVAPSEYERTSPRPCASFGPVLGVSLVICTEDYCYDLAVSGCGPSLKLLCPFPLVFLRVSGFRPPEHSGCSAALFFLNAFHYFGFCGRLSFFRHSLRAK